MKLTQAIRDFFHAVHPEHPSLRIARNRQTSPVLPASYFHEWCSDYSHHWSGNGGNLGPVHDRADGHGELFTALLLPAFVDPGAVRVAGRAADNPILVVTPSAIWSSCTASA